MAFRKRTYATAFKKRSSRFAKKRRTTFRRKARRTTDFTQANTHGTNVGFRGRKISRRAYKKHIWNSTIFKDHYRSIDTEGSAETAPADFGLTGNIYYYNMYKHTSGDFWTAAGGAQEVDAGTPVPIFEGGVILRGGVYELTLANQSGEDLKVKLWTVTTGNNPDFAAIPASQDAAWDPSVTPDFYNQFGKPTSSRQVILEHGGAYTYKTRFKTQKIDEVAYGNSSRTPFLVVMVSNINANGATAFRSTRSYNLSFSGDVVTPGA